MSTAAAAASGAGGSSNSNDDDIIGEEIRPLLVETHDIRLQILHAVLLDHTYVNRMPLELPTTFAVQQTPTSTSITNSTGIGQQQQWSLGGIGAVATATAGSVVVNTNNNNSNMGVSSTPAYPMYSSQCKSILIG